MAPSSPDTSPGEPPAYLDVWVWVQGQDRTERLVQGAPVPTLFASHRGPHSVDVVIDCPFEVTYERLDEVPMGVIGIVAYQFFVKPTHPLYADFDGFEYIGPLPGMVRRILDRHVFKFHLSRTFVVPTSS